MKGVIGMHNSRSQADYELIRWSDEFSLFEALLQR